MGECRSGRCTIPNISTASLDILLNFMSKNARDILLAADKYDLLDLKKAWEEALEDTLNLENAADVLLLADMTSANDLKKVVLDLVEKEAGKGDAAEAVDKMTDKAVKSGRTELVRELFSAVVKSGRKW
ncbi:hypothetical protein RvY_11146 [Ramazzottius varieornatus]|uniref:BTB domain-containing protein n=1 Tax=Ramazzottius varieornatus TaxID=947166 RepID=A0A1D1VH73_RAMVA|nr:hypothetical protein RvY_11146 [Ramazzottius varieornatus]